MLRGENVERELVQDCEAVLGKFASLPEAAPLHPTASPTTSPAESTGPDVKDDSTASSDYPIASLFQMRMTVPYSMMENSSVQPNQSLFFFPCPGLRYFDNERCRSGTGLHPEADRTRGGVRSQSSRREVRIFSTSEGLIDFCSTFEFIGGSENTLLFFHSLQSPSEKSMCGRICRNDGLLGQWFVEVDFTFSTVRSWVRKASQSTAMTSLTRMIIIVFRRMEAVPVQTIVVADLMEPVERSNSDWNVTQSVQGFITKVVQVGIEVILSLMPPLKTVKHAGAFEATASESSNPTDILESTDKYMLDSSIGRLACTTTPWIVRKHNWLRVMLDKEGDKDKSGTG
ncbi:hypothetical protein R1sor_011311 [Riccia sorocarpa]|uniref:Uncharacterized protein n=1 Tax=Riccia sorocarpa TaxID=122646 RepID=A0ABD3I4E7_9MARC